MGMVSVIMNTVNERRDYLDLAIQSWLNQEGIEIELIVSTVEGDVNIDYIRENYPLVNVVTMPREDHPISKGGKCPLGSFMQINNALPHINGGWFTFASSNDIAYPFKALSEVKMCQDNSKLICYSDIDQIDENGSLIRTVKLRDYDRAAHQQGNFVADCSMVHISIVRGFLPFRTELNNYAYWDLWLRVYEKLGDVFIHQPRSTWGYRQDSNSMHVKRSKSPEQIAEAQKDRSRMLALHPLK